MARPENRDYTRDSCIRWSPERGLLIVEEKKGRWGDILSAD